MVSWDTRRLSVIRMSSPAIRKSARATSPGSATRNDVPQLAVAGKEALLRSQGRVPSSTIRIKGDRPDGHHGEKFPAHGGGRAIQSSGNSSGESEAIPREILPLR